MGAQQACVVSLPSGVPSARAESQGKEHVRGWLAAGLAAHVHLGFWGWDSSTGVNMASDNRQRETGSSMVAAWAVTTQATPLGGRSDSICGGRRHVVCDRPETNKRVV